MIAALLISIQLKAQDINVSFEVVPQKNNCGGQVQGLIAGEKLVLKANASGSGLTYTFWHSNQGFKAEATDARKREKIFKPTGSDSVKIELPELRDEITESRITFGVDVQDKNGNKGRSRITLPVTRELVFVKDTSVNDGLVCYEILNSEKVTGIIPNQNDTDTRVSVSEANQVIVEKRNEKSSTWTINPLLGFSNVVFSFFGYSRGHLNALANQVNISVFTTTEDTLNPGDVGFVWTQKIREVHAYQVYQLDACRNRSASGLAYVDKWYTAYGVKKIDPTKNNPYSLVGVGNTITNSCEEVDGSGYKQEVVE